MLLDPIQDVVQGSSSKLDIPADQSGVNAKRDVVELGVQLCSVPDFRADIANEHGHIERDVIVAIE